MVYRRRLLGPVHEAPLYAVSFCDNMIGLHLGDLGRGLLLGVGF